MASFFAVVTFLFRFCGRVRSSLICTKDNITSAVLLVTLLMSQLDIQTYQVQSAVVLNITS